MLQRVHSSVTEPEQVMSIEISSLLGALADCCHPRAGRLREQLAANPAMCARELAQVQRDTRHVLCLSFGTSEAARRLSAIELQ